jgi:hypothetical protein
LGEGHATALQSRLWTLILAIACGALLFLALIEWWLRRRWLARRAAAQMT